MARRSLPQEGPMIVGSLSTIALFAVLSSIITKAPIIATTITGAAVVLLSIGNLRLLQTNHQRFAYTMGLTGKWLLLLHQAVSKSLPMGGNDWEGYHRNAVRLLQESDGVWGVVVASSTNLFNRLVAIAYSLFGVNTEQVYFFVFVSSLLTFRFIFLSANELTGSKRRASIAALLFFFWPIEVVMSVTFLREMPIQCLIAASFYYFILYVRRKRSSGLWLSLVLAGLATALHSGVIGILLAYLFIAIMLNSKRGIEALNPLRVVTFVFVVTLLMTSSVGTSLTQKFGYTSTLDELVSQAGYVAGNTAYVTAVPRNPFDLVLQSPWRVANYALAPMPWQVFNVATLIAWLLDGVFRIWLVFRLISFAFRRAPAVPWQKALRVTVLMSLAMTYLVFAWGTANYGTAIRHRAKTFPIEIVVAYALHETRRERVATGSTWDEVALPIAEDLA